MKLTKATTTKRCETYHLDAQDILDLLRARGVDLDSEDVESIEVVVHVPGGGDWSHTDLEIDSDATVDVRVRREVVEEEKEWRC